LKLCPEVNEMLLRGVPERFWLVTRPTEVSDVNDVCCSCTVESLMHKAKCGLRQADVVGIFDDEREATETARKLLGEQVVSCDDSLAVEVLVRLTCRPTKADITAKSVAQAAVEAVGNALHQALDEGRLGGEVRINVGGIELHNRFALFGSIV
jgi:hypothetical protein